MPVINRIAAFADEMSAWRQWLHRHPELGFDLPLTSSYVAERLRDIGVDALHQGIAETGMVALIEGRGSGPTLGLRADMDALPIAEETGLDWTSEHPGRMHACGHDGHMVMLLGAAKYLAETRNFRGRVALIFQPAEETGGGAKGMVQAGVMEDFDIREVYALHNAPDLPVGRIATRPGPIMAAVDEFNFTVRGLGGHAAYPDQCRDPIQAAMELAQTLNQLASEDRPEDEPLVVKVTQIHSGNANNIVPYAATLSGTVRTFSDTLRHQIEARIRKVSQDVAATHIVQIDLDYERFDPATENDPGRAAFAALVARDVVGPERVNDDVDAEMIAEDFGYMLKARPGAYLFVGQESEAKLHQSTYDFRDEIAPIGASFFARLVEMALPLEN